MIELKHISKTFHRNTANPIHALRDVSLVIENGSFVVVVGSNGSGKSTLLNVLAGTVRVDEGQVLINRQDITRLNDYHRSKWMARIFQDPVTGTSPELTILENFRLAYLRTEPKKFKTGTGEKFRQSVREKIHMLELGLENKLDQPMGTLSGGQRQALTLLMAIMPSHSHSSGYSFTGDEETKILLMDEPTAALDPKTSKLILGLANRLIREYGLTVIFVTHQLRDALHYGNRIIRMDGGKIVQDLENESKARLTLSEVVEWYE